MSTLPMPVAFVTDFGPMPAVVQDDYTDALGELGRTLRRPKAILAMSGHWETVEALGLTAAAQPDIIYDFSGFPDEFYNVKYRVPGDPGLAADAAELLRGSGFSAAEDHTRGLDHGVWAPLSRVYPKADVPIVQLTVPARWKPERLLALGRALAPLREREVLLVAAGSLVHNLRLVRFGARDADSWAEEFDEWLAPKLDAGDARGLTGYLDAPHGRLAAPSQEHFAPLFFALGAAEGEKPRHFYRGIKHGSGVLRAFAFGA